MKVAIVGATGMIGRRLTTALLAHGDEVLAVSRHGESVADAQGVAWDAAKGRLDPAVLAGVDAVVNLAGASIGSGRWTDNRKREIVDSRLVTTSTAGRGDREVRPADAAQRQRGRLLRSR